MDLWIRSQLRGTLVKVDGLFAVQNVKWGDKITETIKDGYKICTQNDTVVGIYETKKRCVEILDEIQAKLMEASKMVLRVQDMREFADKVKVLEKVPFTWEFNDQAPTTRFISPETIVYQMPKD